MRALLDGHDGPADRAPDLLGAKRGSNAGCITGSDHVTDQAANHARTDIGADDAAHSNVAKHSPDPHTIGVAVSVAHPRAVAAAEPGTIVQPDDQPNHRPDRVHGP